jgi:hypothetical protein
MLNPRFIATSRQALGRLGTGIKSLGNRWDSFLKNTAIDLTDPYKLPSELKKKFGSPSFVIGQLSIPAAVYALAEFFNYLDEHYGLPKHTQDYQDRYRNDDQNQPDQTNQQGLLTRLGNSPTRSMFFR